MKHLASSTGNTEWYTPAHIIEVARAVMGSITTDPCSTPEANETVKARTFYTAEQNGLTQDWEGNVWLNPPYARGVIDEWIDKLQWEVNGGTVDHWMVLVNNATDTQWCQRLMARADAICLIAGRVRFGTPTGEKVSAPLQGQILAFGYALPDPDGHDRALAFHTFEAHARRLGIVFGAPR